MLLKMSLVKVLIILSVSIDFFYGYTLQENQANIDVNYDDFLPTDLQSNDTYKIINGLTNTTKLKGDLIQFLCEIQILDVNSTEKIGVKWHHNLDGLSNNDKNIKILTKKDYKSYLMSSTLKIKDLSKKNEGFYTCTFSWMGLAPIESKAYLKVVPLINENLTMLNQIVDDNSNEVPKKTDVDEPFCQSYTGPTCQFYLGNQYVFVQPPHTLQSIEESLKAAYLVVSQSNDISVECSKFVLPSLCYSAFPLCKNTEMIHLYQQKLIKRFQQNQTQTDSLKIIRPQLAVYLQRICKDECVILETELCNREYAIAKRHPIISKVLDLEECENLPNESEKHASECLKLGIDGRNIDESETCYWGNGAEYRGVHDVTKDGVKCKRWAHQFEVPISKYPELLGHSYCRNPGSLEKEPFCYIEQTKKEPCGLKKCSHLLTVYIMGGLGSLILILSILTWLYWFKKRNKTRNIQNMNIPSADKNIYGNGGPNSPIELNTLLLPSSGTSGGRNPNKNSYQNIPNFTHKEVNFIEELGEGAFGKVYKGELKTKTGKIFVAVKSLKENASAKTQADFQREIELISELKHPNIICLLGIVVKQEPFCMLFEYMSEGDLHEFLIANSPVQQKSLNQTQFLHISIQIAQGMEYLSDNHYVHRDLAARNCLVSNDLIVKISDFGLSRDMYSCDYYRVQSKSLLPVRWMPPESILYGKFTTESDVWSYGVVLWEIYSYGLQPYYGYNNQEVISMIRSRKLLPCPDSCPSYCYSLMVECWAELAIRRPSFGEIGHRLKVWKRSEMNGEKSQSKSQPGLNLLSHFETNSVCPLFENQNDPSLTWERNLKKNVPKLSESQSSLMSRASNNAKLSHGRSLDRNPSRGAIPLGLVVSTSGEGNVFTKIT
nr:tyrosine-protein kinase transmembrane receptor Ror-like [Onthophagus taurus]